jgi:hypothetical protein
MYKKLEYIKEEIMNKNKRKRKIITIFLEKEKYQSN